MKLGGIGMRRPASGKRQGAREAGDKTGEDAGGEASHGHDALIGPDF
jgi:hypothetical protein